MANYCRAVTKSLRGTFAHLFRRDEAYLVSFRVYPAYLHIYFAYLNCFRVYPAYSRIYFAKIRPASQFFVKIWQICFLQRLARPAEELWIY